jgi:cell wall-associated NlpC family hydrolase/uncharacterized protein YgiM (DUF1202 family)
MRKPLLALGLAASIGIGVTPVAALAAHPSPKAPSGTTPALSSPTSTSTSSTGTNPGSFSMDNRTNSVSGAAVVAFAYKFLGYPYTAVGNSPATGFSCIGFASYVYRSLGIPLPGDLGNAYAYAPKVPFSDLLPGDLLYFQNTVWPGLSHVAIYIGNGQFIHSEYFGLGVRISSFENDPRDYNYWIQHYLGANRPWSGPVGAVPPPPTTPSKASNASSTTTLPSTVATTSVTTGSTAIVTVPSLNVRRLPSKTKPVATVIGQGTTVTVLHHGTSWSKVELADGMIGYVVNIGIGGTSGSATASASSGAVVTVSQPTAPARVGQVSTATNSALPSVRATVSGLNVHSGPGVGARVITSVPVGTTMTVLKRSGKWIEVQLSTGQTGWVSATYATSSTTTASTRSSTSKATKTGVAGKVTATHPATTIATSSTTATTTAAVSRATQGVNVRTKPSLRGLVVTELAPKGGYTVLKWSGGWARVRLADGTTGWVSGRALGISPITTPAVTKTTTKVAVTTVTTSSTKHAATSASKKLGAGPNVVTVGVKVHTKPSLRATVETVLPAGTHVTVLGERGTWKLVRLATGTTGYIYATYVR